MTKTQLDNLIKFSFIFKTINYQQQSPDYIKEKWDYYIGSPIPHVTVSDSTIKWRDFWHTNDEILPVVEFLKINSMIAFVKEKPSDILDRFGRIFDISTINDKKCTGLHENLVKALDMWVTENLRDYNLCLLT